MSASATSDTQGADSRIGFLGTWALAALIVALAVAQMVSGHLNGDNSWFITFAEKVANGARAYVDVSDPNPPAAFLLYMPAVHLAHVLGVSAEAATIFIVFLLAAASLALTARVVAASGLAGKDETAIWRNAALFLLLVAPGFGFAEREHFALLFVLPLIALSAARASQRCVMAGLVPAIHGNAGAFRQSEAQRRGVDGRDKPGHDDRGINAPPASLVAAVGLVGGLTVCVKPHYAAAIMAAAGVAAWRARSWRVLFALENLVAAGVFVAYACMVALAYPAYFTHALPAILDVYGPARQSMLSVVATPPFVFVAIAVAAVLLAARKLGGDARAEVICAAALGFLLTYVVQAKGWFNHAYPAVALAALAAVVLWTGKRGQGEPAAKFGRLVLLPALVCAPVMGAVTMNFPGAEEYPGLTQAVRDVAPARPKIAALAEQLDVGHPLTRRLGGQWIGRQNALWISNCVSQILTAKNVDDATKAKLVAYAQRDRAEFAEDVRAGAPDILLAETTQFRQWAQMTPELAPLFEAYALKAKVGEIEIWTRAPNAAPLRGRVM